MLLAVRASLRNAVDFAQVELQLPLAFDFWSPGRLLVAFYEAFLLFIFGLAHL